jgi:hypothetical protein
MPTFIWRSGEPYSNILSPAPKNKIFFMSPNRFSLCSSLVLHIHISLLISKSPTRGKSLFYVFCNGSAAPWGPRPPHFSRLHDHAFFFRHTTLGRTPLDEGPASRRDLYLTTHNTHKRQTSMPPGGGFEPTIPVSEQPQTHAVNRAAARIDTTLCYKHKTRLATIARLSFSHIVTSPWIKS